MGLMPTPMQGQAPQGDPNAAPPADPSQAPPDDGQQSNVSPEEQQIYDQVMHKAADIIYGNGKVMPEILKSLAPAKDAPQAPADQSGAQDQGGADGDGADAETPSDSQKDAAKGNPAVLALANTATQIVNKLDTSSKQANVTIPDDVLYHAGVEIIEMLAEVAEAANIHSYSQEELQGAFYQAVDNYRPIAERMGRTDDQTLKDQFGQIEQADQQGKLGEVLPGLDSQPAGGDAAAA